MSAGQPVRAPEGREGQTGGASAGEEGVQSLEGGEGSHTAAMANTVEGTPRDATTPVYENGLKKKGCLDKEKNSTRMLRQMILGECLLKKGFLDKNASTITSESVNEISPPPSMDREIGSWTPPPSCPSLRKKVVALASSHQSLGTNESNCKRMVAASKSREIFVNSLL